MEGFARARPLDPLLGLQGARARESPTLPSNEHLASLSTVAARRLMQQIAGKLALNETDVCAGPGRDQVHGWPVRVGARAPLVRVVRSLEGHP